VNKFHQAALTNQSVISFHDMKITRFNRTHQAFKGSVKSFMDIDNNVLVQIHGALKKNLVIFTKTLISAVHRYL
jgi:UDP-N-acetylmuramate-alanine ligase